MTRRELALCQHIFLVELLYINVAVSCNAIYISSEEPGYWYGWSECRGPGASDSSHEASRRKTARRKWSVKENCGSRRTSIWRGVKRKQTTEGSSLDVAVTACCLMFIIDAIQMLIRKSNKWKRPHSDILNKLILYWLLLSSSESQVVSPYFSYWKFR